MRHSGAATKKEAVRIAIEEYNRRKRMARLSDFLGRFDNFIGQEELEQMRESDEEAAVTLIDTSSWIEALRIQRNRMAGRDVLLMMLRSFTPIQKIPGNLIRYWPGNIV